MSSVSERSDIELTRAEGTALKTTPADRRTAAALDADRRPWLTPQRERVTLFAVIWLAAVSFACGTTIADPDLWGHTLYGLRAIAQGVLVERTDPFSYTAPGAAWINHEWLSEYQFGWLWLQLGSAGLWLWRNAMVGIVFAVAGYSIWRAKATLPAMVMLLVFNAECLSDFAVFVRPQLATFALFALSLCILRRWWDRPGGVALWLLPALMAFWVNLHGGFLAGLGIQGLFAAAASVRCWKQVEFRRPCFTLWTVFALSALATLMNPYGIGLHKMLWYHLGSDQIVREWLPLWAMQQSPTFYAPLLLIGLSLVSFRSWKWIDVAIFVVVGYEAFAHLRHIALLSITTLILLPGPLSASLQILFRTLSARWSRPERIGMRAAAVIVVAITLIGLQIRTVAALWHDGIRPWDVAVEVKSDVPGVPSRAIALMKKEQIAGNLLTDYGWGQYVLWQLHPQIRVAFDGRYRTVYPEHLEAALVEFQRSDISRPQRTPLLDDYPTEIVLLPARRGPCEYLDARSDWVLVFADSQSRLYLADIPRFQGLIARSRNGLLQPPEPESTWTRFGSGLAERELAIGENSNRLFDEARSDRADARTPESGNSTTGGTGNANSYPR